MADEQYTCEKSADDPYGLLSVPQACYGSRYQEHLLEQYKLYVEMADRISARRASANTFFLTANAALLAAFGALRPSHAVEWWPSAAVALGGLVLCAVWMLLIRSYRQLNTGKWAVVGHIEGLLPMAPYAAEWRALGCGKNWRKYLQLTVVETIAISAFTGLYVLLLVALAAGLLTMPPTASGI